MEENNTPLTTDEQKTVEETISQLFDTLEVTGDFEFNEEDNILTVTLDTQESGIVIGYHGEVLEALQLLMALLIAKKLKRFKRVSLEVGDYKKNREAYLETLADRTKERALDEGREQILGDLKPWERRVIHLYLQDDQEVQSESQGTGRDRVLVVKPRG